MHEFHTAIYHPSQQGVQLRGKNRSTISDFKIFHGDVFVFQNCINTQKQNNKKQALKSDIVYHFPSTLPLFSSLAVQSKLSLIDRISPYYILSKNSDNPVKKSSTTYSSMQIPILQLTRLIKAFISDEKQQKSSIPKPPQPSSSVYLKSSP